MDILQLLQDPEKQIDLMMHSVNYINARLETFYNTEPERIDIQRNKDYLEIMLSKPIIADKINAEQLTLVQQAIDKASSVLLNDI